MKIHVGHSTVFDFEKELYEPLKRSALSQAHDFHFPHDGNRAPENTKEIIKNSDLLLAEVSYPSTGLGIELGWADVFAVPVIAFYRFDKTPSQAIHIITNKVYRYSDNDLILMLTKALDR
ncbi:MAG: hypothetical protein H6868_06950 [Rhodospirillales bacterium]|nr:hypothetical protein [Rhodospirillales bacterium]